MGNVLGNRIRFLREERDLSQVELARRLTMTNVQLNRYETGKRHPDPETLLSIADFFNVPTDYLLGRSSRLHEAPSEYISSDDRLLITELKNDPELHRFVRELLENSDQASLLLRIWQAIRNDVSTHH
ncbi:MAG: helix-turn-helix transcriptional regulator [Sporolactobacillus sp.]